MGTYTRLTVYTDGASRGNPGLAAAGIHIVDETTSQTVVDLGFALGITTNNVAEYQAVLHAAQWLLAHKELLADDIHISFRLDSSLVVSQLSGQAKINYPHLQQLAGEVRARLHQLPGTHTFEYIPREENKDADRVANDTLDKGFENMEEHQTGIPLADGLSCTLDATKEHPERYATIIGGAAPLPLNKAQALALFRIMLSHLAQLAGDDLDNDTLLQQVDLIQLLAFSMELLDDWSDTDLEDRHTLREALEQYDFAYDFHETLMRAMRAWEEALRLHYDRIESAASNIDVDLEELREEDEDELEDEAPE
jgi:ribonuclease HI